GHRLLGEVLLTIGTEGLVELDGDVAGVQAEVGDGGGGAIRKGGRHLIEMARADLAPHAEGTDLDSGAARGVEVELLDLRSVRDSVSILLRHVTGDQELAIAPQPDRKSTR